MASYLIEAYTPIDGHELAQSVARIASVARAMSRQGIPVRHRKAILVPGDETCFYLVDAPSADAVERLVREADFAFTRIVVAVEDDLHQPHVAEGPQR
jgi:hypothetical protein